MQAGHSRFRTEGTNTNSVHSDNLSVEFVIDTQLAPLACIHGLVRADVRCEVPRPRSIRTELVAEWTLCPGAAGARGPEAWALEPLGRCYRRMRSGVPGELAIELCRRDRHLLSRPLDRGLAVLTATSARRTPRVQSHNNRSCGVAPVESGRSKDTSRWNRASPRPRSRSPTRS